MSNEDETTDTTTTDTTTTDTADAWDSDAPETGPRVWIGCQASYDAGTIFGRWFDIELDEDTIGEKISGMIAASPTRNAEEFHVCDGAELQGFEVGQYTTIAELAKIGEIIGDNDPDAIRACIETHMSWEVLEGCTEDEDWIRKRYRGAFDSDGDYCAEYHELCGTEIPNWLERYVDWVAMERDWVLGGDISIVRFDGQNHVVSNNE